MNNLYIKLAFHNIRKNKNTFMPFCIICTTMTAMFYMLNSLVSNTYEGNFYGATSVRQMLSFGQVICGIIAVVVVFYTNSFVMKRRTKELGLYSVLGLEKRHIRRVLFWEILQIGLFSTVLGLLLGALFTRVGFLVLLNIIGIHSNIPYHMQVQDFIHTIELFVATYAAVIVFNGVRMLFFKPIELLKSQNHGEREPKFKLISALLGLICLGIGYYISIVTTDPTAAIVLFFVAVLLVVIGTYLLFTSGSIVLLKLLKKNKKYYYHKTHFITVSGMIYRMKQNAVGLATICILSTMVLVTLSATFSLYLGTEDQIRANWPRDVQFDMVLDYQPFDPEYMEAEGSGEDVADNDAGAVEDSSIDSSSRDNMQYVVIDDDPQIIQETAASVAKKLNLEMVNPKAYYVANSIGVVEDGTIKNWYQSDEIITDIFGYTVQGYHAFSEGEYPELEQLQKGEVYLYCTMPELIPELEKVIARQGMTVKEVLDDVPKAMRRLDQNVIEMEIAVVLTRDVNELGRLSMAVARTSHSGDLVYYNVEFCYEFDLSGDDAAIREYADQAREALYQAQLNHMLDMEFYPENREEAMMLFGSLFFIGVFLGLLFLMTTVLIIYYKQITEGYEDSSRFAIMEHVGMSKKEVKKVIHNQILTVFFLPILMAVVHICFAFQIIKQILRALQLTNVMLFVGCTIGTIIVFCIIYAIVYSLTAKIYYRIVNSGNE